MSAGASIAITIVVLVLLAIVLCCLNDRVRTALWRWRNPPEKIAAEKHFYEARLLRPDWAFYEQHLQRPVPAELRSLFSDQALLLADQVEYNEDHCIRFCALDAQTRSECQAWLGLDAVPFANSHDNLIYLQSGPGEPDTVFITYHDGGDTEILAPTIAEFVERLHQANRPA